MVDNITVQSLVEALQPKDKSKPSTFTAVVTKKNKDGTAWVQIAGSEIETPIEASTADVKSGDAVTVEWRNNRLYIAGNTSNPSAGVEAVGTVERKAVSAQQAAENASRIAGNTNQYFWHTETGTDTGAHITEVPRDEFLADPTNGGGNLLARSNGIAVRDGLTELATFGANGVRIGEVKAPYYPSGSIVPTERYYNAEVSSNGFVINDYTDPRFKLYYDDDYPGTKMIFHPTTDRARIAGRGTDLDGGDIRITTDLPQALDNQYGHAGGASIEFRNKKTSGNPEIGELLLAAQEVYSTGSVGVMKNSARITLDGSGVATVKAFDSIVLETGSLLNEKDTIIDANGNIGVSGGVFIKDHTNTTGAIGHFSSSGGTNSSFATGNSLTQINAPIKFSAGTWLIIGDVAYPSNTNGSRCVEWRSGATTSSLASINASRVLVGASSSGFNTRVQTVAVVQSNADVYLSMYGYMYTGSSTSVSVDWYWRAIRIA